MSSYLDNFFSKPQLVKKTLFILAAINLVVFAWAFGFHPNNDTDSYIFTIEYFRGERAEVFPNRYLNPFYALVGSSVLFFVSPANSIIITNILFYFGLLFLTYGLLKRVLNSEMAGFFSALLIMTSYTLLRYGLTQVQDIGGYFWYVLTIYAAWRWWEDKQNKWLYVGGLAAALGMLTKESGTMGALFFGVLFLLEKSSLKERFQHFLKFSILPFIMLVINQYRGMTLDYNSGQWFLDNWKVFGPDNYHFIKWFGVNVSTYNFLWLLVLVGLVMIIKNRKELPSNIKVYLLAILLPSLSYFAWPIFISRTVFISAWLFVPIAVYALMGVYARYKYLAIALLVVAVVMPYILQNTLKYAHVFQILDICKNNIGCSWNYFWDNRDGFSKTM